MDKIVSLGLLQFTEKKTSISSTSSGLEAKMRTFKIDFTVLILICSIGITTSEVYEIFRRRPKTDNGWKSGTDSFKIPRSLSRPDESSSMNCAKFNARANGTKGDHCLCSCPSNNATFIFDKNHWTCLRNSKVRDLLGK